MPFYQDFKKKKMTRADHLRSDSKWEEEGARYRRSTAKAEEQRRESREEGFSSRGSGKPQGKTGFHGEKSNSRAPPGLPAGAQAHPQARTPAGPPRAQAGIPPRPAQGRSLPAP